MNTGILNPVLGFDHEESDNKEFLQKLQLLLDETTFLDTSEKFPAPVVQEIALDNDTKCVKTRQHYCIDDVNDVFDGVDREAWKDANISTLLELL